MKTTSMGNCILIFMHVCYKNVWENMKFKEMKARKIERKRRRGK